MMTSNSILTKGISPLAVGRLVGPGIPVLEQRFSLYSFIILNADLVPYRQGLRTLFGSVCVFN